MSNEKQNDTEWMLQFAVCLESLLEDFDSRKYDVDDFVSEERYAKSLTAAY